MMQIDDFLELAKKRRSVRRFKPDPVPDECIEKILEAARRAMSGANGQPWEFIVVKDQETKNKLAQAKSEDQKLTSVVETIRVKEMRQPFYREYPDVIPAVNFKVAPVIIVVCGDPRTLQASTILARLLEEPTLHVNLGNANTMIHLAAAACGLSSQWVTVDRYFEKLVMPILNVPPIMRIFTIVPIGYPAYEPEPTYRRELKEIVHYEKYDMSKYRSHEQVQEFIRELRERSKPVYPLK